MQNDESRTLGEDVEATVAEAVERTASFVDMITDPVLWFDLGVTAVRVVLILTIAYVLLLVIRRLIKHWQRRFLHLPAIDRRRRRMTTGATLLRSLASYTIWISATLMVLSQIGLDVRPLLAGAGIAGLAIGFGAQTLVRDVISGMFLLFGDIIHVGDSVRIGQDSGVVENISLRLIRLRKYTGELVIIPAGELRTFGNNSMGFARAIVNIGLSYEQNTDETLAALQKVADEWASIEENKAVMLENAPHIHAIMDLADSSVNVRVAVQVIPGQQDRCARDLRLLIKRRFDEWGIDIPFPRQVIYLRHEDPASEQ